MSHESVVIRQNKRIQELEREVEMWKELYQKAMTGTLGDIRGVVKNPFKFTKNELFLLLALLRREGGMTKHQLMDAIYGTRTDDPPQDKIVDVFVCKIRRKLRDYAGYGMDPISTVWGWGYRIEDGEARKLLIDILEFDPAKVPVDVPTGSP